MKSYCFLWISILCYLSSPSISFSQQRCLQRDWMLDKEIYKADIRLNENDLVLSNGLVNRIFRNGVTIGLNNLATGEELLRSIRPEAEIILNDISIPIGGLIGQPIHNYFLPEWIDSMTINPLSFRYIGYEEHPIEKRFEWKARKEWMSSNPAWPPKGKMLTLKYKADDLLLNALMARDAYADNREVLIDDEFSQLSDNWKIQISKSNKINSFTNEGKTGEILVKPNTASFAECEISSDAEMLITRINPGTDRSEVWGPGIAWVFNNKTVKFYLRTSENKFGITGSGLEYEATYTGLREGESVYLKMLRNTDKIVCSYSYNGNRWFDLLTVTIPHDSRSENVRVGKMDGHSDRSEMNDNGEIGRCKIEMVKAFGKLSSKQTEKEQFDYLRHIQINVNYEIYDGIPLFCKWISVVNNSGDSVLLNSYKSEILAVVEPENRAVFGRSILTPNMTVETDFAHKYKHDYKDPNVSKLTQRHVHWNQDKLYTTQIDWLLKIPCLLESYPEYGPEYDLAPGRAFESHRTWELLHDTWERERKTMQIRKMYRIAAPWVAENPIFMHVRKADNKSVKKAVDQCAEVGFEMVVMTFGSGVNMEDSSRENVERMKYLADYAHSKGVALGGYSLLASRSIDKENDVVMPQGKAPMFGNSPCIESEWGQKYIKNLRTYYTATGQDILDHDGSYPGDECAATNHPGHKRLGDSQWNQYKTIKDFYQWGKSQGIYLNIPDWYFMNGQNKTVMGYRETNWSLPRKQQEIIERQNIYDGTWDKAPSMGWMMVPLVEYHGGGEAATIEPLKEHLPHYEIRLANNFGAGVMACYRGPQLYDCPETKVIVKKWVDIYKEHRAILDSDIIHLRRPDGKDWDGFLHVNPEIDEKGFLMVYNPLNEPIQREVDIPVYYTGLAENITIVNQQGKRSKHKVSRDYKIRIELEIPAKGYNWYILK